MLSQNKPKERTHQEMIARFADNNRTLCPQEILKVLILDDHRRKFYIGDSYFWFSSYRKNVISLLPGASIVLNCDNDPSFNLLSPLYAHALGPNVLFQNKDWSDIDFGGFDLILCEFRSLQRLFEHLKAHYANALGHFKVFHFASAGSGEMPEYSPLDYKGLFDVLKSRNFLSYFHSLRKRRFSEIIVPGDEISRADKWFGDNGVLPNEKVIVFTNRASTADKVLDHDVYGSVISWLAGFDNYKILIFDEAGSGIKRSLSKDITAAAANKVIAAECLSLRDSMYLMASNYVRAVISPCTGILHLASGICQYLKNNKLRPALPVLITYTGNLSGFDTEYHPGKWWSGSLVNCMILVRGRNGDKIIKGLDSVPEDIGEYNAIALPVREYTASLMISFLSEMLPHAPINVFQGDRRR